MSWISNRSGITRRLAARLATVGVIAFAASGCSAAMWGAGLPGIADGYNGAAAGTSGSLQSRVDGEFTGWTGTSVFKLANGQIWQQSSYAYTDHYAYRPKVLIYRSGALYKMKVDGVSTEISVVRLK